MGSIGRLAQLGRVKVVPRCAKKSRVFPLFFEYDCFYNVLEVIRVLKATQEVNR